MSLEVSFMLFLWVEFYGLFRVRLEFVSNFFRGSLGFLGDSVRVFRV